MFKRLSHSKHITDYHFFYFYEFEISAEIQELSFDEILEKFIQSVYFTDEYQLNQQLSERESKSHNAFLINKVPVKDFKKIKGKDLDKIIQEFINEDSWSDDLPDFKVNYAKSKLLLNYLQIEDDEMFYLNMEWFVDTEKLIETYWIFVYLLTFISINQFKTRLLLFDYGFD